MSEPRSYISLAQASALLGIGKYTVKRLVERGKLDGIKIGASWRIYLDSVKTYKNK
jgi:excisionase family DNA binding protein